MISEISRYYKTLPNYIFAKLKIENWKTKNIFNKPGIYLLDLCGSGSMHTWYTLRKYMTNKNKKKATAYGLGHINCKNKNESDLLVISQDQ